MTKVAKAPTPNIRDHVSEAFAGYLRSCDTEGQVPLSFQAWHDAYAPEHRFCNFCR